MVTILIEQRLRCESTFPNPTRSPTLPFEFPLPASSIFGVTLISFGSVQIPVEALQTRYTFGEPIVSIGGLSIAQTMDSRTILRELIVRVEGPGIRVPVFTMNTSSVFRNLIRKVGEPVPSRVSFGARGHHGHARRVPVGDSWGSPRQR